MRTYKQNSEVDMDSMTMVTMKNKITGTTMWVSKDRVDEYIAMGHEKVGLEIEPIVYKKEDTKLTEAAEKLKKTVSKAKKTTRKKA